MYFVTGLLFLTSLISSSLAGEWCFTDDGSEYCENDCCVDDDSPLGREKCCDDELPAWAIILMCMGVLVVIGTCLLCLCCIKVAPKDGHVIQPGQGAPIQVSTVPYGGYQPTGFQQYPQPVPGPAAPSPYPSGAQPPGALPNAPIQPYPSGPQPPGALPTAPPPSYQTVYGQQDYGGPFGPDPAPAPNPAFPTKQ